MIKPNTILWCLLTLIFVSVSLFYFFQRSLIYNPSKIKPTQKAFQAEDFQQIRLMTTDGIQLNSWYKAAANTKPTVIVFHGNAGHIGTRMPLARQLTNKGFGVFLLEYRGYGGNLGRPTEKGLYEDARTGINYLKKQQISEKNLILYGESIGTSVATKMAIEFPKACALILQSPYTTLAALAKYHYPWNPIAPWDKFDSLARIKNITMPVLMLHGTADTVVPYEQGLSLFNAANEPKQWVTLENQGHSGLWTSYFVKTVSHFISSCKTLKN